MMKVLSKSERDFLVCSDCIYFDFVELIDERYPLKRGRCSLHNKIVNFMFFPLKVKNKSYIIPWSMHFSQRTIETIERK